jgi:hypothetical protein
MLLSLMSVGAEKTAMKNENKNKVKNFILSVIRRKID